MVLHCRVPNCKSMRGEPGISFHCFPKDRKIKKAWIVKLKIGEVVSKTMHVCSKHFVPEDFFQLEGYTYSKPRLKVTAIPSANFPRPSFHQSPNKKLAAARKIRQQRRENLKEASPKNVVHHTMQNSISQNGASCELTHELEVTANVSHNAAEQIMMLNSALSEKDDIITNLKNALLEKDKALVEMSSTFETIRELKMTVQKKDKVIAKLEDTLSALQLKYKETVQAKEKITKEFLELQQLHYQKKYEEKRIFRMENLKCDDALINYYTGVPTYAIFTTLLNYLVPGGDRTLLQYGALSPNYLDLEDQLLAVLSKFRHNFGHKDLAIRFGKSSAGISKLFKIWVNFMYLRLGSLTIWPHRDNLIANSPSDFISAFPNVMVIIDGTELYIEKASDLSLQSQTYSAYKGSNTLKGLIGVDQRGGIVFVSKLMDGSASDNEIVKESGLLSVIQEKIATGELQSTDEVMADKGFTIQELLSDAGMKLVMPPFASNTRQMCKIDVAAKKSVAKYRVHVERAMARIKKFKILSGITPVTLLGSVNQVWTIVCFLANVHAPLLAK